MTLNFQINHKKCINVHKAIVDACKPFRPILSAIGTFKFPVTILSCLTINEFTVKDFFLFAKQNVEQDSNFCMGNLDVNSLFTNIPLEETINHLLVNT